MICGNGFTLAEVIAKLPAGYAEGTPPANAEIKRCYDRHEDMHGVIFTEREDWDGRFLPASAYNQDGSLKEA